MVTHRIRKADAPARRPATAKRSPRPRPRAGEPSSVAPELTSGLLLDLQRTVGNRAVGELIVQRLWIGGDDALKKINTNKKIEFLQYVNELKGKDRAKLPVLRAALVAAIGQDAAAAKKHESHLRWIDDAMGAGPPAQAPTKREGKSEGGGEKVPGGDDWLTGRQVPPKKKVKERVTNKQRQKMKAAEELQRVITDPDAVIEGVRASIRDHAVAEGVAVEKGELDAAVADLVVLAAQIKAAGHADKARPAEMLKSSTGEARRKGIDALAPKVAEKKRRDDIVALRAVFVAGHLNAVTADGVRDDAIRDGLTPAVADNRFQAAFDAQRKPSKNKWLDHLNMRVAGGAGAWDVRRVGMHDGLHIHRTWANSAVRQPGAVHTRTADELMDGLFAAVVPLRQNHVSLEVPGGVYPHVYWGGLAIPNGYGGDWPAARTALEGAMTAWKDELQPGIQHAKDRHGDI